MKREAKRTLYTLSSAYQRFVSSADYNVIVIDNNSTSSLDADFVTSFGSNFEYHFFNTDSQSPAKAINFGVDISKTETVACIVDGARMVSPCMIHYTLKARLAFPSPLVMSLAWHLGPKEQNQSMLDGYNQLTEDELLNTIDWKNNGYRLFEISTQASSSKTGFFGGIPEELSYFAIKKSAFEDMGGFSEDFQSPGGGLVNHDFLQRATIRNDLDMVMLIGEGSFHQFHGGVATNAYPDAHPFDLFSQEYKKIKNSEFQTITQLDRERLNYIGSLPDSVLRMIKSV